MLSWEVRREPGGEQREASERGEPAEAAEAVEILREVWTARGQGAADLEDMSGPQKSCKRMADVGFDGLADQGDDMRAAWRETLERDGKLSQGTGSVRDLVFGGDRRPE